MCHQRLDVYTPRAEQPEKLLHVAVLGPSYIGDWVILPLLLVKWIVAAGAISTRHEELNLFHVHLAPWEAHLHRAHHDNATAVFADLESLQAWSSRLRRRRHNHAVHAAPVGQSIHGF